MEKKTKKDERHRSWMLTYQNPPNGWQDLLHSILERMPLVYWCFSLEHAPKTGTPHVHIFITARHAIRFSTVRNYFLPHIVHIEEKRKGTTRAECRAYVGKFGKWYGTEKAKSQVEGSFEEWGKVPTSKDKSGHRSDLDYIEDLIEDDHTPNEIFDMSIRYRQYEKMVKGAYYRKRFKETPASRKVTRVWCVGSAGSGKSHREVLLTEQFGEDSLYAVSSMENGYGDVYSGEPILFIDDIRPDEKGLTYKEFLVLLDVYRRQIRARSQHMMSLWDVVIITSVFPPEVFYRDLNIKNRDIDSYAQLARRIDYVAYHYIKDGEYRTYTIPMEEYVSYDALKARAESADDDGCSAVLETLI